jgi:lipoyl(octanoyl) transferase
LHSLKTNRLNADSQTSPISWLLLRSSAASAAFNMAMDEALLETSPARGLPVLRFYSWSEPAASFGYFQKYAEVERATLLRPLVRRPTGGGIVPHDADWTYSLAVPPSAGWYNLKAIESYQRVHEWIRSAFQKLGIATELADDTRKALPGQCFAGHEKFDVLWQGRKIAGAAQRRTRNGLLIQGSVQPPPIKISRADWENAMRDVAESEHQISWRDFQPDSALQERVERLAQKTYSSPAYNQRR